MASNSVYITDFHSQIPGKLSDDKKTWLFPVIESINAHKKQTEWCVKVKLFNSKRVNDDNIPLDAFLVLQKSFFDNKKLPANLYGWIKVDSRIIGGKIKKSVPTIVRKGKNIGKKSETNTFCQALRDALGMYNKQIKKAKSQRSTSLTQSTTSDTAIELYPPMLAQVLKKQKSDLGKAFVEDKFMEFDKPMFIQRKFNGVRAITTYDKITGEVIMYSRGCIYYPGHKHIKEQLKDILINFDKQIYLDGELYKHGVSLQEISGQCRRQIPSNKQTLKVDYMIFDCFIKDEPEMIFSQRFNLLQKIFAKAPKNAKKESDKIASVRIKNLYLVDTIKVKNTKEVNKYYKQFLSEKFEGAMLRLDAPYQFSYNNRHSKYLLKMKQTFDAEFEIVGWTTARKGKAEGLLMIICKTNEGKEFPVTPSLPIDVRKQMALQMPKVEANSRIHFENHWLGEKIIIYFDEWSKDKIPQRARTELQKRVD